MEENKNERRDEPGRELRNPEGEARTDVAERPAEGSAATPAEGQPGAAAQTAAVTSPEPAAAAQTATTVANSEPAADGTPAAELPAHTVDGVKRPRERTFTRQKVLAYLKGIPRRYFITAFSGMAIGLFCTLIAGTIVDQIGKIFPEGPVRVFIQNLATLAKVLMGAGIGLGIAHSLKAPKMVIASCAVAGFVGAHAVTFLQGTPLGQLSLKSPGDPITSYVCALAACELGILVSGKTKIDILVVPLTVLFVGALVALGLGRPIKWLMDQIGNGINLATLKQPFVMGVLVSASMGLLLTLPTSSAAIGVAIDLSGIAAGAAVAGCCAHMVGFAVASFRENRWGGLVAQGLGTSMLQIPNLGKNPRILIPAVAASLVCGPVSSCLFQLQATKVGSGMGTAGLVGIIDCIGASAGVLPVWQIAVGIAVTYFILPAAIALGVSEFMRKMNWIRPGDMKLDL